MRWIMRWNEIDSGAPAASGRRARWSLVGLWQITHSSVVRRWPPCRLMPASWHALQLAVVTEVRRGVTAPVTATYLIGFIAASRSVVSALRSPRFRVAL